MQGADLAITGEGRVDFQTAFGKTPSGVAAAARKFGVPVVAIGGGLPTTPAAYSSTASTASRRATPNAMPLEVAIKKSRQYLQDAAERVARLIVIGQRTAGSQAAERQPKSRRNRSGARPNKPAKCDLARQEAARPDAGRIHPLGTPPQEQLMARSDCSTRAARPSEPRPPCRAADRARQRSAGRTAPRSRARRPCPRAARRRR